MRRLLLVLVGLTMLALAASAAPAHAKQYACGTKKAIFLFWKDGHGAIPSVNFPPYAPPHLEYYVGTDRSYPDKNYRAFVDNAGGMNVAPACREVRERKNLRRVRPVRTTRKTRAIACSFPRRVQFQINALAGGGYRFNVVLPRNRLVVQASIAPSGSKISFSRRFCKATPVPT